MRIVMDCDIWGGASLFAATGDVVSLPGRAIGASELKLADALIVRSVTRVDETLLAGSTVRFVGTATSGTDHVDLAYLERRGIAFADAAGCNARPVVEYVLACLFERQRRTGRSLDRSTLGVVGVGRIGRGIADWSAALGMRVLAVDPPLARTGQSGLCTLDEMLAEADVVSLHVPLTIDGSDATRGLIDASRLARMKPGAWLVNAARGGVVVDADLIAALDAGRLGGAVLDVWQGEPVAPEDLLRAATLLTPHIAGYSAPAHRRAARRIADQLREWIESCGKVDRGTGARVSDIRQLRIAHRVTSEAELRVLKNALDRACDLRGIDAEYRQRMKIDAPAGAFDAVRAGCRTRSELTELEIDGDVFSPALRSVLAAWAGSADDGPGLNQPAG